MAELPEGRTGRVFALLLLALVLASVWAGVVLPLRGWYADRADELERQTVLAQRMERIAAELPEWRLRAASVSAFVPVSVLAGESDSVAGAALQQRLQQIGADVGATVASAEVLPGEQLGNYRRIGVRLSISGTWPAVIRLLAAIAENTPRLLVNDLQMQSGRNVGETEPTFSTSMVVFGFRAGNAS